MGFNSDDSESEYDDVSTDEDSDHGGTHKNHSHKSTKKGIAVAEYKQHKDDEGFTDVGAQIDSLLKLRDAIGMNECPETIAKERELAEKLQAKQEERRRLSEMTQEERMKYQATSAHDLMEEVKQKFERNMKLKRQMSSGDIETDVLANAARRHSDGGDNAERDIKKEMEELRKKKLARRKKRPPPRTKSSAF